MCDTKLIIEYDSVMIAPEDLDKRPISYEIGDLLAILKRRANISKALYDVRQMMYPYNDVFDVMVGNGHGPSEITWHILTSKTRLADAVEDAISERSILIPYAKVAVSRAKLRISSKPLDMERVRKLIFLERYMNESRRDKAFFEEELSSFLDIYSRDSILGLLSMFFSHRGELSIQPYHALSAYDVQLQHGILLSRPAITSAHIRRRQLQLICAFERLINTPGIREEDLQRFFEQYPFFLRGVNPDLCRVYPQVLLHREEHGSLRPDFILEPLGARWCELLDIKLPSARIAVGNKNRRRLSTVVLNGIGQLKEYQRFFEDSKNRDEFKQLMRSKGAGDLDCYYPQLSLIIGMDATSLDEDAIRRQLMTMYHDIRILTYSQLLQHAKRYILL